MSAPQHIGVGAPTGRLAGVREQTCRLPSKLALGSRQVGCLALGSRHVGSTAYRRWGTDRSTSWRWGADVSAPQQIVVGEPTGRLSGVREQTCRLPSKLSLGSRQVGPPEHCRWGPDMSAPYLRDETGATTICQAHGTRKAQQYIESMFSICYNRICIREVNTFTIMFICA